MNQPSIPASCDQLPANTLRVEQAQQRILDSISPLQATETLSLMQALGRILAEAIIAPVNVPPHRNSAMDGYALRQADAANEQGLKIIGTAFAGRPFQGNVQAGECVRIMTGAVVPEGADSVVMQENVQRIGDIIHLNSTLKMGENVRHPGEDMRIGDIVLGVGRKLNATDIGLLASLGIGEVTVLRRPRVAFCSTGDELKRVGESLQPGDIYDSNRYSLFGMLQKLDVEVIDLGVVRDTPEAVEAVFQQASQRADVFITSGGVSVGEADYVTETLQRLGEVNFWKIAIKPGKPLTYGKVGDCRFFGLPGNPVAVIVTFLLFVRPAILRLRGESTPVLPEYMAICDSNIKKAPGRKDYQRGICERHANGQWRVRSVSPQGSHILSSLTHANCFLALPLEAGNIQAGSEVTIVPFEGLL